MLNLLEECQRLLSEAGIETSAVDMGPQRRLAFESTTVLGFAFAYENADQLLRSWQGDVNLAIESSQLALRRAAAKAWNTYVILLAEAVPNYVQAVSLSGIEEDLTGTRKIARAGIADISKLRAALLPLLPIQNAPRLEAADMVSEIRLRTTELPPRVVEAFLSAAPEAVAAQIFEESP